MEMLATPATLLGLLIGLPAGMVIQHARHLSRSYQNAKTNLHTQKEVASSAETRGAVWIVFLASLILLVIALMIRNG